MVVCKYFLQGTCKFGSNCHYDHDISSSYNYNNYSSAPKSTSILRQPNFANNPATKPTTPANIDVNTLIKSVVTDANNVEKGGQWLLSSYTPFKEKPAFPGFDDQSFEEVRMGFYDASKSGTVDQYNQQLQMVLQNTMSKIRALQNPSQEIVTMLATIYNTPPSSCSGTYGQNTLTTSSPFGQMNTFTSQNQSPSNIFQNNYSSNAFSSSTSSNIFAGGKPQSGNIFAATSPTNQNIFASNQNSMFSQQPQQNLFAGQSQNVFSSPPNQNVFSPPTTNPPPYSSPQQNLFTQNQPQNLFSSPPQQAQQSIFATQNQSSQNLFTTSSQQPIVYGNSPMNSASIFGANNQTIDESLYSKLDELGVDEIKWFESDDLDIMHIPDKPPTYAMCFRS